MVRIPCCDNNNNLSGLKKGPWTPEEDRILVEYIRQHGHGCWRALPSKAGLLRCGKSCRLRWTNYLRPDIKRGNFSSEEEQTIVRLHAALGNKWSVIAGHLPGRTDNEIKNYWNTRLKKRLLQMGIDPVTHGPALDANSLTSSFNLAPCQMTGSWDNGRLEDESSGGLISRDRYLRLVAAAAAAYSVLMFENHYPDLCNMSSSCRNPLSEYLNYCASFAPTLPADYGAVLPLMSLQQYILEQNTNNFPSIHTEDGFPIVEDLLIAGAASESCDQRKKNIVKEDCNSLLSTILQESVLFNSRDEALSNSTPAAATQYCRVEEQLLSAVMKDEPKLFTTYSSSHEITNTLSYPDIVSDNNSMDSNCGYWESLPPELLYNQGLHCNTALPPQSEIMTNIVSYLSSGAC